MFSSSVSIVFVVRLLYVRAGFAASTSGVTPASEVLSNTVLTNCSSAGVLLPPAPGSKSDNSSEDGYILEVDFGGTEPGAVNCSWIIDPADNATSNAVTFLYPVPGATASWCRVPGNSLVAYDLDNKTGNTAFVDVCGRSPNVGVYGNSTSAASDQHSGEARTQIATGGRGIRTVIQFAASNRTQRSLSLFRYQSFAWPDGQCGTPGELSNGINATEKQSTFEVPDGVHRLPNKVACVWEIRSADPKNVVQLGILSQARDKYSLSTGSGGLASGLNASFDSGFSTGTNQQSMFYILMPVSGPFVSGGLLEVPLTDEGLDFHVEGLGGNIFMTFVAGVNGGAPPFTVTVRTDTFDLLCPPSSSPMALSATHNLKGFKGVNHPLGQRQSDDRECAWNITTEEEGLVVQLVHISNMDYLSYVISGDHLELDGRIVEVTTNLDFPYWSTSRSMLVKFHASAKTMRSEFILTYKAVPAAECQGHPVTLNVLKNLTTATALALGANDTINGTSCRWLLKSESGRAFQATVRVYNQSINCSDNSYFWGRSKTFSAYYTATPGFNPTCIPGNNSWVLTSLPRQDFMVIVFNRNPDISYVKERVTIEFAELPDVKPSSTAERNLVKTRTVLLSFVFGVFSLLSF